MQPANPDPAHPASPGADFYRELLKGYRDIIVVLDDDGIIRYATPSAAELFGSGSIIGSRLSDLVGDDARPRVAQAVDEMLGRDAPEPGTEGVWQLTGLDGQALQVEVDSSDLRGTPAVGGLVLTLRDVTRQRQREDELRRQANYDPRTGLPNAKLFEDRADHAVALARRAGTTAVVMLVDLDDFKQVNDTLGHLAGNELLAAAAARLAGLARESDTVARYGGDEFAILLENLPDPAAAVAFTGRFAERVIQAFRAPFRLSTGQVTIGVSVGAATTANSASLGEIVDHADLALYAAKDAGKGTWRAYDPARTVSMPAPRETRARDRARFPGRGPLSGRAGSAGRGDDLEPEM